MHRPLLLAGDTAWLILGGQHAERPAAPVCPLIHRRVTHRPQPLCRTVIGGRLDRAVTQPLMLWARRAVPGSWRLGRPKNVGTRPALCRRPSSYLAVQASLRRCRVIIVIVGGHTCHRTQAVPPRIRDHAADLLRAASAQRVLPPGLLATDVQQLIVEDELAIEHGGRCGEAQAVLGQQRHDRLGHIGQVRVPVGLAVADGPGRGLLDVGELGLQFRQRHRQLTRHRGHH